jgi:cytochrome c-type biogenesis protein CcmH
LKPFWKTPVDDRDLGLAYAMAANGDSALQRRAYELLQEAASKNPDDVAVLIQLARFYETAGRPDQAIAVNERILRLDPMQAAVAVNLGTQYIERGRAPEAMRLWQDALTRNPALTGARVNLAVAQFRSGDASAAQTTLRQALLYDPDQDTARKLLEEIRAAASKPVK